MGIKSGDFVFDLSVPLKYAYDGSTHEAHTITLQEPSMEHNKFTSRLEQMISRAEIEAMTTFNQIQNSIGDVVKPFTDQVEKIESQFEQNYETLKLMIKTSEKVDAWDFLSTFEKMVCIPKPKKSICLIDGRAIMTSALWENLNPKDAKEMAYRWCAFFVMPSEEGLTKSSGQRSESHTELMEV